MKRLKKSKLPLYKKGKGLPIGNMTSQIMATFYLNELDHFIKEKLGIKYYIRYMDDGVLIHEDKKYLEYCLQEIEKIINDYKLTLNKKTRIFSNKDNIEFLGFSFIIGDKIIMKVKSATKRRIKKRINEKNMSSYLGHLSHGDCHSLTRLILEKYV